jgi:hypothetical protein
MKTIVFLMSGLAGSLMMTGSASAAVASHSAVVHDISSQYAGMPGYAGRQTWAVFVRYEHPTDVLVNNTLANIHATSGTFFNGDPFTDDPLGLISPSSCLTPISPGIIAMSGYGLWAWDTNLSIDNLPQSVAETPGAAQTPVVILGGAFFIPPPIGVSAGADLLVQVAQITMTTGGTATGETSTVTTLDLGGRNPLFDVITIDIPGRSVPCPADLNGDGEINTLDLGVLLSNWSIPQTVPGCGGAVPCPADLNGDGSVNSFDLAIMLTHWGGC